MRRTDLFLLGVTAFLLANCVSYLVLSTDAHIAGWDNSYLGSEVIGFPLIFYRHSVGITESYEFMWQNAIADLCFAVGVSFACAMPVNALPPLWPGHSRRFNYSLSQLLAVSGIVGVLLAIGMTGGPWALLIRNLTCFAGPSVYFLWLVERRELSWIRLTLAAAGMLLITLAADFRHENPLVLEEQPVLVIARPAVPLLGMFSFLVIASALHPLVRQYYDKHFKAT